MLIIIRSKTYKSMLLRITELETIVKDNNKKISGLESYNRRLHKRLINRRNAFMKLKEEKK